MQIKQSKKSPVKKRVLDNGMTVLVNQSDTVPNASIQLWYNVGSKDEKTGERGMAHLIEHMIFKGTQGKKSLNLSESDINTLIHKLSGGCNAFTGYDYTGYLFNVPAYHVNEIFPVMADCMCNGAFKDDHLNSEMKAVIQELKMYRDNYQKSLLLEMISAIFPDHPYHYPIIGFKQDLWNIFGDNLRFFYKKHYVPNNATLVVAGDVNAEDIFSLAEKYFGKIPADPHYKKETFYFNKDIGSKTVDLYRDVKQSSVMNAFVVPGSTSGKDTVLDLISWILGNGKGSRLYRKLVDELQLVTSLETDSIMLFDHGIFLILYEPKKIGDVEKIEKIIQAEIDDIVEHGLKKKELARAIKKAQMRHYSLMENKQEQAYEIGKHFLATGDEQYLFNCLDKSSEYFEKEIKRILASYCRAAVMYKGFILPLPEKEKSEWLSLQELSDKEDKDFLSKRIRTSDVEKPLYALTVNPRDPNAFAFPKSDKRVLSNGLTVLYNNNEHTPKINLILSLKAKHFYDTDHLQGLHNFMSCMLTEGTKRYSATEFADKLESRGMSFVAYPGGVAMSMLHDDFEKGLELLSDVLINACFDEKEIEKVREQILVDLKNYWDEPLYFSGQLVRETIYKGHPYSKNSLGNKESIAKITRQDLIDCYAKYITPKEARLIIVGDVHGYDVPALVEKKLGAWDGPEVVPVEFPSLEKIERCEITYPMNRDQVVLCLAGKSIERKSNDFDMLLLFDQIFGGGVSMNSRLFQLREQTGLFYAIRGVLAANANEQPGMVLIKTIVSLDKLEEAEKVIRDVVETAGFPISAEELQEAKRAILCALINNFESNASIAEAFLFLDRYNFAPDFFDKRPQTLAGITVEDMHVAVKKYLNNDNLFTLKIGRVQETKNN